MSDSILTPENLPAEAPEKPAAPRAGFRLPIFHNGVFWSATPALALFALAVISSSSPLPEPIGKEIAARSYRQIISSDNWVVPASQTIMVERQSAGKYSVLRGRLQPSGGDMIVSPRSGEVTSVLVQQGQSVRAGQSVVLLATGMAQVDAGVRSSPIERFQGRAEAAQIAAARQQEKLESRMSAANKELNRAKERVAEAQSRVAQARQLIARLQKGEEVSGGDAPRSAPAPRRKAASSEKNKAAKAEAIRASAGLQAEAEAAEAKASAAQKAAREAESRAESKQQKLESAQAAAKSSERRSSEKASAPSTPGADGKSAADSKTSEPAKSSGNENGAASRAVSVARESASDARTRAGDLRSEAARLQERASSARSKANAAARRATRDLQIFDGDADEKVAPAAARRVESSGGKMTIAQAAQIARGAMKESEDAIADAERIRREVESYGRPVQSTRENFDRASEQLQAAQQQVWENAPVMRTRQSPVFAPRGGIVTWVAQSGRVIHGGEAVAGFGRPDRLEVVVEDRSPAWRSLKPNARVLALVQRNPVARVSPANAKPDGAKREIAAPLGANAYSDTSINIPTLARVIAVAPPKRAGWPARVRILVHNPPEQTNNNRNGRSPRAFAPGMAVFFSVAQPSKQTAIRVPTAAVRREANGKTFVAVLSSTENQVADRLADQCRVVWREVKLAPGDGLSNRVKSGLKEGERLALRPDALYDFTLAHGAQATVSVEQI